MSIVYIRTVPSCTLQAASKYKICYFFLNIRQVIIMAVTAKMPPMIQLIISWCAFKPFTINCPPKMNTALPRKVPMPIPAI
jgi:hypothetical protein